MIYKTTKTQDHNYFIQIYPVSEGYLRKIPVERRGKYSDKVARDI